MEIIGRSWEPINSIRLGAIHTVHKPTGAIADSPVWFEPYHAAAKINQPAKNELLQKRVRDYHRRLEKLTPNYKQSLVDALVLYVRAFDEWNQTTAFLRLWTAFESLLSPGHGDYEAIVRRSSFLWDDVPYHAQTLEHLREFRNSCVHSALDVENAKTHCYQLQQYFRNLVHFHLGQAGRFISLDQSNEFLDLPTEVTELERRRAVLTRALRFRRS
jgi:hypothetical protein